MEIDRDILYSIVEDVVRNVLVMESIKPLDEKWLNEYYNANYKESLNEMSRINTDDFNIFPYNKFDVVVWSNDHNPPHFHVIAEGWDIVVAIENGEIIRVKNTGKSSHIYSHVKRSVNDWLDEKNKVDTDKTNREIAMIAWKLNNSTRIK